MALVESFALHARSLVDFFFRDKGRSDDAFAAHFLEPGEWADLRPEQGRWIREVRHPALDRFGKEIAHLNYHRVALAEQARGWPGIQIAGAIGEVLWTFVKAVPSEPGAAALQGPCRARDSGVRAPRPVARRDCSPLAARQCNPDARPAGMAALMSTPRPDKRPSRITQKGYRAGERPGNYGRKFPPTLLQPAEVVRLLHACDDDKRGRRLRTLIAVLYRAGPLVGEALALRLDDVDLERRTLRFVSQRQTDRIVGMDAAAFEVLEAWLAVRRSLPGDLAFCTINRPRPGKPVHPAYFRTAFGNLAEAAGLAGTRVHPQAFRFSLAAELIIEGWPLSFIQAQLGIKTLYAMDRFLKNLDIGPPDPADVVTVVHTRNWDIA